MATVTNFYTSTFTPSLNGYVGRNGVNESLSTIRSGAGNFTSTATVNNIDLTASTTTNQFAQLLRVIALFDTSSIPAGATILSATLRLCSDTQSNTLGDSPSLELVSSNPASTSVLANADYGTLGSTSFSSVAYASFPTGSLSTLTLNSSGLSNITKGGISKFGFRSNWDLNNNFTGSWASSAFMVMSWQSATGVNKPLLTVNYSVDFPSLSVNNISSLSNVTIITTS